MKIFNSMKSKAVALFGAVGTVSATAADINVDLSPAETAVTTAGLAMIGLAVTILTLAIVYGFLKKRG